MTKHAADTLGGLAVAQVVSGTMYVSLDEAVGEGMASLSFVKVGRQIRFVADPSAARKSGIRMSSKLLDLAVSVR